MCEGRKVNGLVKEKPGKRNWDQIPNPKRSRMVKDTYFIDSKTEIFKTRKLPLTHLIICGVLQSSIFAIALSQAAAIA